MAVKKSRFEAIKILDIGFDIKGGIAKTLARLPESFNVLAIVRTKRYYRFVAAVLDIYLNDNKMNGLYISTNKPVEKLMKNIETERKIDPSRLRFIDCMAGPQCENEKTIYCPPQNLTELNLNIGKILKEHSEIDFVVLDSLTTLFIYNEPKTIEKFVTAVIRKINDKKIKGVFISTRTKATESTIEDLGIFFDEVLESEY